MATFMIPGKAFEGVTALGSRQPEAGFYEVSIVEILVDPNHAQKRRFRVQLPNGYRMLEFVSLTHDADGTAFAGLEERQVRGRTAGLRTILESLGYTSAEIEGAQAISDEWFLTSANGGRKGYGEFVPGQQGVEGSWPNISRWLNQQQYDALNKSGAQAAAPVSAPPGPAQVAAPNPTASANGVGGAAKAALPPLPPAPGSAQQIVG